jgi:cell division protein ZipA
MEITTIVGIIITILIMLYGLKLIFKKPVETEPSLDTTLHVDPDSQQPVIPRHVRDQLQEGERVEPSLEDIEVTEIKTFAPEIEEKTEAKVEEEKLASNEAIIEESAEYKTKVAAAQHVVETPVVSEPVKKVEPEFMLKMQIEKAEIAEFNDESSILDAHLYEQKRVDEESALATAEDLVALNIFPDQRVLSGEKTLKVMLKYGLRYGEMQCFHRYSEDGSKLLFSVLQVTPEGGTDGFDLETLSTEEVKGLAFFMALPHDDVQNAFDTMDSIARLVAREVQGTVYDQTHQEFTPQLREYWRHQAIDFRSGHSIGA